MCDNNIKKIIPKTKKIKKNRNNISPPIEKQKQKRSNDNLERNDNLYNNTPLRISTLNVRGVNNNKMDFIVDHMNDNNIGILGISETNLQNRNIKYVFRNNDKYTGYFTNDDEWRGSGVGIIVQKKYDNYIFNHQKVDGRLILIDMATKRQKIRIIQIYINSNSKE